MAEVVLIVFPVFILVVISLLLSKRWGTGEKVDKGMAFCYWKLSYRRKFIRTLWMIPIAIVIIFYFHTTFQSILQTCLVATLLAIMLLIQAIYNYRKWKNETCK